MNDRDHLHLIPIYLERQTTLEFFEQFCAFNPIDYDSYNIYYFQVKNFFHPYIKQNVSKHLQHDNIHLLSSSPSRTAAGAEVKKTKLEPKEPGAEEAEAVEPGAEEAEAVEPGAEEAEAVEPGAEEAEAEAVEPGAGGAATAAAALATAAAALAALAEVGAAAGAAAAPLMMAIIRCICGNEGVE
ncbi:unnamed protein product [Rotaria sp. Silwood1]|nr:unnamed protein product [Rotaria sp. Silwood1]